MGWCAVVRCYKCHRWVSVQLYDATSVTDGSVCCCKMLQVSQMGRCAVVRCYKCNIWVEMYNVLYLTEHGLAQ